jgi:acetyl-CoA carboxylase biotin carboxyl carrier protein
VDLTGDDVQDILQLLDSLPFGEMHLRTARFSLWLRRDADGEWTQELQILSEPVVAVAAARYGEKGTAADTDGERGTAGAAGGAAPAVPPPSGAEPDGLLRAVRAPLPGTFYRAPMPGAPPFVEVGSRVEPDTVVGIVETMKLMNSVSAGARGTVEQIPLANAQFAERDAVLMWIREDA